VNRHTGGAPRVSFNDKDREALRTIACGLAIFAKFRFDDLHKSIRKRAIPFMR
jgi:hypothetical protein